MRFIEGDIVKIARKSEWFNSTRSDNPNVEGRVIGVGSYSIKVNWDNSQSNYYGESDLALVRRPTYQDTNPCAEINLSDTGPTTSTVFADGGTWTTITSYGYGSSTITNVTI